MPLPLHAGGKTLSSAPDRLGLLTPTDPAIGVDAIRARYREHGYVWLKGLLARNEVIDFRARFFAYFSDTGLVAPGGDPALGLSGTGPLDRAYADRKLMSLVRSAAYERFCLTSRLSQFMDEFVTGLSYLHKRKLVRYTQPDTPAVTPAHYDLIYLRGGTSRVVTAWIPIGDTPIAMGGLVYLEGSHRVGAALEAEFQAKNAELSPEERISAYNRNMAEGGWVSKDLPQMAERFNARWLVADYEAGDVVLHSPFMIHASTTNQDPARRVRLSTDIRYQNVEDEIDARWANHLTLDDML